MSPILTGEQVIDLCTGAGRESLTVSDRHRANILRCCPYLPQGTLPENASLIRVISEDDVEFAKGNSDDETIRDRDLLPDKEAQRELESRPKGYFRPYCYRLEYCRESENSTDVS